MQYAVTRRYDSAYIELHMAVLSEVWKSSNRREETTKNKKKQRNFPVHRTIDVDNSKEKLADTFCMLWPFLQWATRRFLANHGSFPTAVISN